MLFSKKDRTPDVAIQVNHKWYEGNPFVFYFHKKLPQSALDAEKGFLGIKESERDETSRASLIKLVANMVTKEPDGFSDFPRDDRPLAERFIGYFDAPDVPEFEAVIVTAWRAYKVAALPEGFPQSVQNNGSPASGLPGATGEAPPVV
jgi:hypothetical protein